MIRPDFRQFYGAGQFIAHSAKGTTWGNHKYTSKREINGKMRYFYGNEPSDEELVDILNAESKAKNEDDNLDLDAIKKKAKEAANKAKKTANSVKKKVTKTANKVTKEVKKTAKNIGKSDPQPTTMGAAAKRAAKDTANYASYKAKETAYNAKTAVKVAKAESKTNRSTSKVNAAVNKAKEYATKASAVPTKVYNSVNTAVAKKKADESLANAKSIASANYNKSVSYSGNTPKTKTTSSTSNSKVTEMWKQVNNENKAKERANNIRSNLNDKSNDTKKKKKQENKSKTIRTYKPFK